MADDPTLDSLAAELARRLGMVDDVIDPADTRRFICDALDDPATKHLERPWRKHGVRPV